MAAQPGYTVISEKHSHKTMTEIFTCSFPLITFDNTSWYFKLQLDLPIKGTESEVAGIISATSSIKTVRESRTVMPAKESKSQSVQIWGIKTAHMDLKVTYSLY